MNSNHSPKPQRQVCSACRYVSTGCVSTGCMQLVHAVVLRFVFQSQWGEPWFCASSRLAVAVADSRCCCRWMAICCSSLWPCCATNQPPTCCLEPPGLRIIRIGSATPQLQESCLPSAKLSSASRTHFRQLSSQSGCPTEHRVFEWQF